MRPQLTDTEYRWFSEWVSEEFGLVFGPEKRDILRSRLEPRRAALGFETFEQLYFHLKFHPDREAERQKLIPHLTNNESYFFRESRQIDILVEEVLPTLRDRHRARNQQDVRILSAGCAAGEEPYSIAIAIKHSGLLASDWKVRITGIDLDPRALERARAARYGENAFRRLERTCRDRYFAPEDGHWKLDEEIRGMVRYQQINLARNDWVSRVPSQDVIFCRNVLIYFSAATVRKVVDAFYDALVPGGVLFLGHAETLSRVPTRFVTLRRAGAVFYQRPGRVGA